MVATRGPTDPVHAREIEEHERETKRWLLPYAIGILLIAIAFILILRHPYW